MTPSSYNRQELDDLLNALCEDHLDAAQRARLNEILSQSRTARQRYLQYVAMHGSLHWDGVRQTPLEIGEAEDYEQAGLDDAMVLPALHLPDEQEDAPSPQAMTALAAPRGTARRDWYRRPGPLWAAAAVLAVAIGVVFLIERNRDVDKPGPIAETNPVPAVPFVAVATITAEAGAKWSDRSSPVPVGTRLASGQSLDLGAGFVELSFAQGATVLVEGPARLTLHGSDDVSLAVGKLVASVPGGGFVVRTPASTITDLGTEFGVDAGADGSCAIDVFAGSVSAVGVADVAGDTGAPIAKVLNAGQAANVTREGKIVLDPRGISPQRFVRRLSGPDTLDVVDLLAGGDGTTGRRGYAIDPRNGAAGRLANVGNFVGDGRYHPVPSVRVVDGCFVPTSKNGPMQVDSAGHRFQFPPSADANSFNLIWLGGPVQDIRPMPQGYRPMSSVLGGVDYAAAGRSHIALHPEKGFTIDLAEVRRLNPGRSLVRFRSTAGNTWTPLRGDDPKLAPVADLIVLVDGKPAFQKMGFGHRAAFEVDVAIKPDDRYLTIAVTDGGDFATLDWIILGDPRFELSGPRQ